MNIRHSTLCTLFCAAAMLPAAAMAQAQNGTNMSGTSQASSSQAGSSQSGSSASSAMPAGHPPVVTFVLIPVASPDQQQMKQRGCWVKMYGDKNYKGENLTLQGPVDMPDMVGPFGIDWKGKIHSLETGPRTTLRIYDNENYRDLDSTFKPGTRTPDISKRMGFFDQMSSLQMSCK